MLPTTEPITIVNQIQTTSLNVALFTLAGTILAALIAGGFLLWNEHKKREATATAQDADLQRALALGLLTATRSYVDNAIMLSGATLQDKKAGASKVSEALADLEIAADSEVITSATTLAMATASLGVITSKAPKDTGEPGQDRNAKAFQWYLKSRREFVNLVRTTYGVKELDSVYPDATNQAMYAYILTNQGPGTKDDSTPSEP